MHNYLYLHGFNSAPNPASDKVKSLEEIGTVHLLEYDSFATRDSILADLASKAADLPASTIHVGTSLGAYYAAALSARGMIGSGCVLINPCLRPHDHLKSALEGENAGVFTNYKTGETKHLTAETVASYKGWDISVATRDYPCRPLVVLDSEDEVFDSYATAQACHEFKVVIYPGGNHRFASMAEAKGAIESYFQQPSERPS